MNFRAAGLRGTSQGLRHKPKRSSAQSVKYQTCPQDIIRVSTDDNMGSIIKRDSVTELDFACPNDKFSQPVQTLAHKNQERLGFVEQQDLDSFSLASLSDTCDDRETTFHKDFGADAHSKAYLDQSASQMRTRELSSDQTSRILVNDCLDREAASPYASKDLKALTQTSANKGAIKHADKRSSRGKENEFSDSELDASIATLASASEAHLHTSPRSAHKLGSQGVMSENVPCVDADREKSALDSHLEIDEPHKIRFNRKGEPLPFVRSPFPSATWDRSPILGLSNSTVLRTCFRIGEALNAASNASRAGTDAVIELYARVIDSSRDGCKQSFFFADIFTDNPPHLQGVYAVWKGVDLWDGDASAFLEDVGKGRICRVLGRLRKKRGEVCELNVLSIWCCKWYDMGIAKAIACS